MKIKDSPEWDFNLKPPTYLYSTPPIVQEEQPMFDFLIAK